jgi:hypothetical protein
MRRPVVFFDMDGVLCNFHQGAMAAHGINAPLHATEWDFVSAHGFGDIADPAFWKPLENPAFWENLEPLADGMELFEKVQWAFGSDRIGLLSSGACPGSADGKRAWLRKHLPLYERRLLTGEAKALAAAPCKLLVEDSQVNADAFTAAGGWSVLVPRPFNRRRAECRPDGSFDPLAILPEVLAHR